MLILRPGLSAFSITPDRTISALENISYKTYSPISIFYSPGTFENFHFNTVSKC